MIKIIACCMAVLFASGCVLTQRATDADKKQWEAKLETAQQELAKLQEYKEKADAALLKAESIAERVGSEEAKNAVAIAREQVEAAEGQLELANNIIGNLQQQVDNIEVGSPMWVNIVSGAVGVLGTVLAARGIPGGGSLLLNLTENPVNRRRIAKQVLARDKWVEEIEA